ncbi:hypothetical protein DM860_007241 [Cuscuta australis]|uniref:Protein kinase domain-containing protein n=1 Tax=Cuscuta australis TaxID=267555 RepID=A0A328E2Y7_9ASTE|nr:hypothetical protein DM860_007241 [Cuscuta australis]
MTRRGTKDALAQPQPHKYKIKLKRQNEDLKFLVYKYTPNGDLSSSLFRKNHSDDDNLKSLDWITRLKIAIGAAEALSYLHHESTPPRVRRSLLKLPCSIFSCSPSNLLFSGTYLMLKYLLLVLKCVEATRQPEKMAVTISSFYYASNLLRLTQSLLSFLKNLCDPFNPRRFAPTHHSTSTSLSPYPHASQSAVHGAEFEVSGADFSKERDYDYDFQKELKLLRADFEKEVEFGVDSQEKFKFFVADSKSETEYGLEKVFHDLDWFQSYETDSLEYNQNNKVGIHFDVDTAISLVLEKEQTEFDVRALRDDSKVVQIKLVEGRQIHKQVTEKLSCYVQSLQRQVEADNQYFESATTNGDALMHYFNMLTKYPLVKD